MITIISRKHLRYVGDRDEIIGFIAVASSSELPAKDEIDKILLHEASRAWDISTGKIYGLTDDGDWHEQPVIQNPIVFKGRVDTVEDLPSTAETGWMYLVGLETDTEFKEYVYTDTGEWDFIGFNDLTIDSALSTTSENPVQNKVITQAINDKQDAIDSSHKLSADLVDDSNATNKFTTAADITKLGRIVMDSTESTMLYFQSTQPSSPADGDIWIG